MRGRDSVCVEVVRDLGEGLAAGVFGANALDELRRQDGGASTRARRTAAFPWRAASLGDESPELVDGDELGAPGQLDLGDEGSRRTLTPR
jgi:hypothetical protein